MKTLYERQRTKPQTCFMTMFLIVMFLSVYSNKGTADYDPEEVNRATLKYVSKIEKLALTKALIAAINGTTQQCTQFVDILKLDKHWQTNVPQTAPRLDHQEANQQLIDFIEKHPGITEIIITDAMGATLFAEPVSSDYWQGDEKKFIEPAASGATFIGQIHFDESTNTFSVQVSVPIYENKQFLGVLIAGIEMPVSVVLDLPVGQSHPHNIKKTS